MVTTIRDVVPSLAKDEFTDVAVSYIASMCCTLMDLKHTSEEDWAGVGAMLALLVKDLPADASATLKSKCEEMMVAEEADDDDEDAEELCNCQFTLAYGEMRRRKAVFSRSSGSSPVFCRFSRYASLRLCS